MLDAMKGQGYYQEMSHYPVFLELTGKRCLVVGAGEVGRRKAEGLLRHGPEKVLVIDPAPPASGYEGLWDNPALEYRQGPFDPMLVEGMALVFACTALREVNRAVSEACRERGIFCNVADAPQESDFFVPAQVRKGKLSLAVSTGGASPALARVLRRDLEKWLDDSYVDILDFLEKLRPRVIALQLGADADAALFRSLCASPQREQLAGYLKNHDRAAALALLEALLPLALYPCFAEILDELD